MTSRGACTRSHCRQSAPFPKTAAPASPASTTTASTYKDGAGPANADGEASSLERIQSRQRSTPRTDAGPSHAHDARVGALEDRRGQSMLEYFLSKPFRWAFPSRPTTASQSRRRRPGTTAESPRQGCRMVGIRRSRRARWRPSTLFTSSRTCAARPCCAPSRRCWRCRWIRLRHLRGPTSARFASSRTPAGPLSRTGGQWPTPTRATTTGRTRTRKRRKPTSASRRTRTLKLSR
mmetsp:Transcript_29072/g.98052  ORF Transcript_29072/g.98052 Transcript_29072/m.98052 type:complete len:235 (+) Transcript_29072:271-975(+)